MDKYSGKRAVVGLGIAAKGSGLTSRDTSNHEERNVQYCNRLSCSTRLNSMRSNQIGSSNRDKHSSMSFRTGIGSSVVGTTSKAYSSGKHHRKSNQESQNLSSHKEVVSAETNNMQVEKEVSESSPSTSRDQSGLIEPRDSESRVLKTFSVNTSEEVGSCSVTSKTRTNKNIYKRPGLGNQDTPLGSSPRRPFVPRNISQAVRPVSRGQSSASRYGLRNLGCASISDVLPGCSSDSSRSRRTDVKKRSPDGECSTGRGKIMSGSSSGGNLSNRRNPLSSSNISFPERPSSQQDSRRTRNWPPSRDGITSVRTRRTITGDNRANLSDNRDSNSSSLSDPTDAIQELSQTGLTISGPSQHSFIQQPSLETPIIRQNSYGRPGSSNDNLRIRPTIYPEEGGARLFSGLSADRDGFRRFNMEGIAEVLLALERIEQDEELTYEQLLVLETNLFLGGLSFHDQHRDMRLDIDNMSYEELLALEEKMGTVSTALTEEALSKCLTSSYFTQSPSEGEGTDFGDDDVKCSICQEEYVEGDELGKLGCEHRYHVLCVQQWLRQKNWCPICKAPAVKS